MSRAFAGILHAERMKPISQVLPFAEQDCTAAISTAPATWHRSLGTRFAVVAATLIAEKSLLNFLVDFDGAQAAVGLGLAVRIAQHVGFRLLVTLGLALALFAYARGGAALATADAASREAPFRLRWLALHFVLLLPLGATSALLYGRYASQLPFAVTVAAWILLAIFATWALLCALAPWDVWKRGARALGVLWIYAILAAATAACIIELSQGLWSVTAKATFFAVAYLLHPLIPTLRADPVHQILDTGRFAVQVSSYCSGLEGVGLILAFCGAWLVLFRKEYVFPRALALIPLGVGLILLLNVVRIAALIWIGDGGYREIAVYGFHSQAGWIAFNSTAGLIAFTSRRSPSFSRAARAEAGRHVSNPTVAYLLPFLSLIAAGMLAHALSGTFDLLYVLRPVAALSALYWCWPKLATLDWRVSWRGVAVGIAAFVVWLVAARWLLEPAAVPAKLAALPDPARIAWIVIRAAGSVLVVPLVEELAFRGFLLRRLATPLFESASFRSAGAVALLVSSLVFGLQHGAMWPAGIAAGLLYGGVAIQTGRMGEALAAHAVTNLLVAAWVLLGDQWQLWQ